MKTAYRSASGFTLVEILIVAATITLLAVIAVPTFVRARTNTQTNTCIHNLQEIESATQQWALESKSSEGSTVTFEDIKGYLKRSVTCPAGGADSTFVSTYQINGVTNRPTCLIMPETHLLPLEVTN